MGRHAWAPLGKVTRLGCEHRTLFNVDTSLYKGESCTKQDPNGETKHPLPRARGCLRRAARLERPAPPARYVSSWAFCGVVPYICAIMPTGSSVEKGMTKTIEIPTADRSNSACAPKRPSKHQNTFGEGGCLLFTYKLPPVKWQSTSLVYSLFYNSVTGTFRSPPEPSIRGVGHRSQPIRSVPQPRVCLSAPLHVHYAPPIITQPDPDPEAFLGSSLLPSDLRFPSESAAEPPVWRCAGWFVKLCHIDLRNPSFSCEWASDLLKGVSHKRCATKESA